MNRPRLTTLKPRIATLPTTVRTIGEVGSARSRRWSGRKLQALRARILQQDPRCRPCMEAGRLSVAEHVDHIVPLEHGGTYDDHNLQPICAACHKAKTARERGWTRKPGA